MGQIILVKAIKDTVTKKTLCKKYTDVCQIYCTAWDYDWEILNHRYRTTTTQSLIVFIHKENKCIFQ